jgi:hypothetical protein
MELAELLKKRTKKVNTMSSQRRRKTGGTPKKTHPRRVASDWADGIVAEAEEEEGVDRRMYYYVVYWSAEDNTFRIMGYTHIHIDKADMHGVWTEGFRTRPEVVQLGDKDVIVRYFAKVEHGKCPP